MIIGLKLNLIKIMNISQNNNEINSNVRGDYSKYNPNPRIQNQNQKEYKALPGRR